MSSYFVYVITGITSLLLVAFLLLVRSYYRLHHQIQQERLSFNPKQRELMHSMGKALAQGQFSLLFQPKISVKTGKICGAEALVRWAHPKYGLLLPGDFIEIAEKSGFITTLGQWILKAVCEQARVLQTKRVEHIRLAMNFSAQQFIMGDIIQDIAKILDELKLPPRMFEVELTESIFLVNNQKHLLMLKVLREMGVMISLDDFGTGYSSLKYLREFPLDALKIDQTFIRQILINDENASIVKAMIALAKAMHMKTIAEGVESLEQAKLLAQWGVEELQGYYFYQPLSSNELVMAIEQEEYLKENRNILF